MAMPCIAPPDAFKLLPATTVVELEDEEADEVATENPPPEPPAAVAVIILTWGIVFF
jgi:hypothetical protein